jgi:transposase
MTPYIGISRKQPADDPLIRCQSLCKQTEPPLHLVENYFAKIKEFRGIATRYDKTDQSFRANINLAASIIAGR